MTELPVRYRERAAADKERDKREEALKQQLEAAMDGHVLAKAEPALDDVQPGQVVQLERNGPTFTMRVANPGEPLQVVGSQASSRMRSSRTCAGPATANRSPPSAAGVPPYTKNVFSTPPAYTATGM